jgi:hypothetical protein
MCNRLQGVEIDLYCSGMCNLGEHYQKCMNHSGDFVEMCTVCAVTTDSIISVQYICFSVVLTFGMTYIYANKQIKHRCHKLSW